MSFDLVPSSDFRLHIPVPLRKWFSEGMDSIADLFASCWQKGADHEVVENTAKLFAIHDGLYSSELKARVARGLLLLQIHANSESDFVQGLKERGIAVRSAYRLMAVARACLEMRSLEAIHRFSQFEFTVASTLVEFLGPNGIGDLIEGKKVHGLSFDGAKAMTTREIEELRKAVTLKDEAVQKLAKENDHLKKTVAGLKILNAADVLPKADALTTAREETLRVSEEILARVALLESLYDGLISPKSGAKREPRMLDAAQIFYHALAPVLAKTNDLLSRTRKEFGPLVDDEERDFNLTSASARKFLAQRERLMEEVKQAAAKRSKDREERRGGRGRPAASLETEIRKLKNGRD